MYIMILVIVLSYISMVLRCNSVPHEIPSNPICYPNGSKTFCLGTLLTWDAILCDRSHNLIAHYVNDNSHFTRSVKVVAFLGCQPSASYFSDSVTKRKPCFHFTARLSNHTRA